MDAALDAANAPAATEPAPAAPPRVVVVVPQLDDATQPRVVRAASWNVKLGAALVDLAACGGLTLGYAVVEYLDLPSEQAAGSGAPTQGLDWAVDVAARYSSFMVGMLVALSVAVMAYESLAVALMGRTAGQKLMGLRLLRLANGNRPGVLLGVWRGLLAGLGLLLVGAGWVWAPFDARRQALHDRWSGLILVEDPDAPPPAQDTASTPPEGEPPPPPDATDGPAAAP